MKKQIRRSIHLQEGSQSGDQFISSGEVKARIVENFQALCTEMEGAGIAHAAYLNKVSYVIIRAISDKADNSATMDYPEFENRHNCPQRGACKGIAPDDLKPENK